MTQEKIDLERLSNSIAESRRRKPCYAERRDLMIEYGVWKISDRRNMTKTGFTMTEKQRAEFNAIVKEVGLVTATIELAKGFKRLSTSSTDDGLNGQADIYHRASIDLIRCANDVITEMKTNSEARYVDRR